MLNNLYIFFISFIIYLCSLIDLLKICIKVFYNNKLQSYKVLLTIVNNNHNNGYSNKSELKSHIFNVINVSTIIIGIQFFQQSRIWWKNFSNFEWNKSYHIIFLSFKTSLNIFLPQIIFKKKWKEDSPPTLNRYVMIFIIDMFSLR